jgi:type VI secretion system protein ImpC
LQLLAALGAIGAQVGGPFLAEADAAILGCQSLVETPDDRRWDRVNDASAERWRALRQSQAARWLGLALPRVLLRVPYGRDSESVDQFPFEEMPASPRHDAYLTTRIYGGARHSRALCSSVRPTATAGPR